MTGSSWTEGDVDSAGVNVHYYRTGQGDQPALVLAHGFTDNGLCWTRAAHALETHFDVVMIDGRNHGKSGAGRAHVADLAGDVAAVIRHLDLDRPAVMGHSVGAAIAAGVAAYHPDLVSRVVLEDPPWTDQPATTDPEKLKRRQQGFRDYAKGFASTSVADIAAGGRKQHPTWHEDEFAPWAASKRAVREDAMAQLDMGAWRDILPMIACPALLVYADGDRDGIVTHAIAEAAAAMNSHLQVAHVADAGHNLRRENFDGFIQAVTPFLSANGT